MDDRQHAFSFVTALAGFRQWRNNDTTVGHVVDDFEPNYQNLRSEHI